MNLKLEKIYKINFTILNKINEAFELCDTIHFHNFHPIIPHMLFLTRMLYILNMEILHLAKKKNM